MGGCSINRTNSDKQALLNEMTKELQEAYDKYSLFADSVLILLKPATKETLMYEVVYDDQAGKVSLVYIPYRLNMGRGAGIAIAVAAKFGKKPSEDEWIAMVHTHT